MLFNPDLPIKTCKEEKKYGLERCKFARYLGKGILSYEETESLVIGISGEWGSGKTSIVNMALEYIYSSEKNIAKPMIMRFNPWNFSDHNQLIEKFFNELSILLSNESKVIEKLKSYFNKLVPPLLLLSSVANSNQTQALINSAKWIEEHPSKSLESIKTELNELLIKNNRKILIVIEDIDRLNNSEIRQMFQLVKLLADFSNTIYILEFDKNIIKKALEEDMPENYGFQYMEKIVQVVFDVPKISDLELELILNTEIEELIKNASNQFNKKRWVFYYQNGLKYLFKDIRGIKRYINNLKFNFSLLKNEVDLADLFAITAIQVQLPDVYNFIKHNKKILTSKKFESSERKEYLIILDEIISENSTRIPENQLKNLLKSIFPNLNYLFDEDFKEWDYHFNADYKPSKHDLLSICTPESFETYFRLSVPEWNISSEEFHQIISNTNDSKIFGDKLLQLNEEGKIIKFIKYLDKYVSSYDVINIPEENISPIIEALLDKGDLFVPDDSEDLKTEFNYMIYRIFTNLVKQFKEKKIQCDILKNAVLNAENSVYVLFELIDNLDEELMSNKQMKILGELGREICQKSLKYYENGQFLESKDSFLIIHWLKEFGFDIEADEIIYDIFSDREKTIKFVKNFFRQNKTQKYDYFEEEEEEEGIINRTINLDLMKNSLEEIYLSSDFELLADNERGPIYALLSQLGSRCFIIKKKRLEKEI